MFDILKNNWNDQSILTIVDFFPPICISEPVFPPKT